MGEISPCFLAKIQRRSSREAFDTPSMQSTPRLRLFHGPELLELSVELLVGFLLPGDHEERRTEQGMTRDAWVSSSRELVFLWCLVDFFVAVGMQNESSWGLMGLSGFSGF